MKAFVEGNNGVHNSRLYVKLRLENLKILYTSEQQKKKITLNKCDFVFFSKGLNVPWDHAEQKRNRN